jgi:hypothetical protein
MPKRKFEIWGHAEHNTTAGIVEGESVGEIVDQTLKRFGVRFKNIHGFKIEVDGIVIKLKQTEDD